MKHLSIYVFLLLLSVACTGDAFDADRGESCEASAKDIILQTKGQGRGTSYIFYLIDNKGPNTQGIRTYGTYIDAVDGQPLWPADPAVGTYDSSKGLRAPDGYYKMFIATPATIAVETFKGSGIYGYEYRRNENGTYVSDPVNVSVGGVYLTGTDGAEYIYDASAHVLRQPRSRIKLNFACGADITSATLKGLAFSNIIDHGFYIPEDMTFNYTQADINESYPLFPKTEEGEMTLKYSDGPRPVADEYILSMNYKAVNENGDYIYPIPSLDIRVGSAYGTLGLHAALGWDFKPQHTYEFTVTINSVYVNLTVKASAWESNGESVGSTIEDTGMWTINFPLESGSVLLLDWEKVNVTGTIS